MCVMMLYILIGSDPAAGDQSTRNSEIGRGNDSLVSKKMHKIPIWVQMNGALSGVQLYWIYIDSKKCWRNGCKDFTSCTSST